MTKREVAGRVLHQMRLDIPEDWMPIIRQAAIDSGAQSVGTFMRMLVGRSPEVIEAWKKKGSPDLPPLVTRWGGKQNRGAISATPVSPDRVNYKNLPTQSLWGKPLETEGSEQIDT